MKRISFQLVLSILAFAVIGAMSWAQSTNTILVKAAASGVNYLTDSKGMTLYYYTKDADGQSACYGNCATSWPIFYADSVSVPSGLNAGDFGTITRTDNTRQTTYLGWPLYYWFKDKSPGEMTGEGVGKVWYVLDVPAYTIMISTNATLGNYLVDGNGNTLYWFTKDSVGQSACTGDCIKNWPAFTTSSVVVPSALKTVDFSTITRADGTKQVAYKGYPLYYWVKDKKRGDVTGQDVNKVWYVIDPAKFTGNM